MDHTKLGREVVSSLLAMFDTPVSRTILDNLEIGKLVIPEVDPLAYDDATTYLVDAQAVALVKKNPWILPDEDGKLQEEADNNAYRKFLEAEQACYEFNIAFAGKLRNDFEFRTILESTRHYVSRILGDFSWADPDFGPGASFLLGGKSANLVSKLRTKPECTPVAHDLVKYLVLDKMPHYAISCGMVVRERTNVFLAPTSLPVVNGNRLSFVPKDMRCSRAICIEPLGNLLAQKAIGSLIKSRLTKWGLPIGKHGDSTLQDRHRDLAKQASIDGINATIDLSSASDTISYELVKFLLPDNWFDAIRRTRSPSTRLPDGTWIRNEKISSMGNGFTFELETLLFYCLGLAVRYHYGKPSDTVSSYGDDIIVPSAWAEKMIDTLEQCGFSTNKDKTFTTGFFRESCGGDFLHGFNVRPIFLKECSRENTITFLFSLANRIREMSRLFGDNIYCDVRFRQSWRRVYFSIPLHWRLPGPTELGDDVCHMPRWEDTGWNTRTVNFVRSVQRLVKVSRGREIPREPDHVLAAALYGIGSKGVSYRGTGFNLRKRYTAGVFDVGGPGHWN